MKLYHGSNCRIIEVNLSLSKSNKDFGSGFYLTPDYQRAVTMANRSTVLNNSGSPEVNPFIFNKSSCLGKIKIKEFKTNSCEWAEFVMMITLNYWLSGSNILVQNIYNIVSALKIRLNK